MILNKLKIINILDKLEIPDSLKIYIYKNIDIININNLLNILDKYIYNISSIKQKNNEKKEVFNKKIINYKLKEDKNKDIINADIFLESKIDNIF